MKSLPSDAVDMELEVAYNAVMNRTRAAEPSAVSQFQLIGGIRHDAGDCMVAVEPGGSTQARKGALYVVVEPAGDPARGGDACGLSQATLAHEYYADPSPSVTTSLAAALNKANNALIHLNRQMLAGGDVPEGLARKIRVGVSAAVVRPGRVYLCQLKPGLILLLRGGQISAFPRPAQWPERPETVNVAGEVVGSFYPAAPLGTGPMVEADFASRSFDTGDLLVLLSSAFAPLLDEAALTDALRGCTSADAIAYLSNLAESAGLPEAHALAVELSASEAPQAERAGALPPPPAWSPDAESFAEPPRGMTRRVPPPPAAPEPEAPAESETPEGASAESGAARKRLGNALGVARVLGRRAAPVVGRAGKATLGAAGTAGKATLGAAGAVLGETLPESVRRRGGVDMLYPDGALEDDEEAGDDGGEQVAEADLPGGRIVDLDAPIAAEPSRAPRTVWLRRLVPIAVVVLLGVLLLVAGGILSSQQAAKISGLLAQAQQQEVDSHSVAGNARRIMLQKAFEFASSARDVNPRSADANRMYDRVLQELDDLNGVTRLQGLTPLVDFNKKAPNVSSSGNIAGQPAAGATPAVAAYFSQVIVQGGDAFLLDKGAGRLYTVPLTSTQATVLLSTGDQVDLVGNVNGKARVGSMLFMAWRPTAEGGDLVLLDENRVAYIWPPSTGVWQAFTLGGADKLGRPRDLASYDGNLYMLWAKDGQVSKWAAGAFGSEPADWLTAAASNELSSSQPIGMTVDGEVRVLLNDGRIVTLEAGQVKSTFTLPVWPPQITSPLAIFSNEHTASIYVVEFSDKRVIRVDKQTGAVQTQLKAPADSTDLDGLRNVAVDEVAGKIYILSGRTLYVAPLPAAPSPPPTPSATPAP